MLIERAGFVVFLLITTVALVWIASPFAGPLIWATLAGIMFQPLYLRLLKWRGGRENQAAALALVVIIISVVIPAVVIARIVIVEILAGFYALRDGVIDIPASVDQLIGLLPVSVRGWLAETGWGDFPALRERAQEMAERAAAYLASQALNIGSGVLGWTLALGVGLYATYFLLRDGQKLGENIRSTVPLSPAIAEIMTTRFLSIVRATIKGTMVVGLVQGAIGGITFLIAGLPSPVLFGVLMAILSLLPAVGPSLVWLPAAIFLLAIGEVGDGLLVLFSGAAIISTVDNILRPILVGRDTGIPDWVVLVTTLGGLGAFGLSGVVMGPVIAGLFISGWAALAEQRRAFDEG